MADFGISEYIAIASLVAGAASTAISYSQQSSAAKAADRMAQLNFMSERQSAQQQMAMSRVQYEANQKLAENQAQAAQANAQALQFERKANENQGRVNADAARTEGARLQAIQNAKLAKSGVVNEGTPLEVLADTAGEIQLGMEQEHWQTSEKSKSLDFESKLAMNQAGEARFAGAVQGFKDQSGIVAGQNAVTRAQLERLAGVNRAKQMQSAATAGLVSDAAGLAKQGYGYYRKG